MNFRQNIKKLQSTFIIETQEYIAALKELTQDILNGVSSAENEATVVSIFENELFSFIKDVHNLKYYPKKEKK